MIRFDQMRAQQTDGRERDVTCGEQGQNRGQSPGRASRRDARVGCGFGELQHLCEISEQ